MNESTSALVSGCATFLFLGFVACVFLFYAILLIDALLEHLHSRHSKLEKVTITLTFEELVELNEIFESLNSDFYFPLNTRDLLQQKIMRPYYKNKYFIKELALIEDKKRRKEEQNDDKNNSNSGNN